MVELTLSAPTVASMVEVVAMVTVSSKVMMPAVMLPVLMVVADFESNVVKLETSP